MGGKKGIFTGKQCVLEIVEQPLNIIQHVRECETKLTKKKICITPFVQVFLAGWVPWD